MQLLTPDDWIAQPWKNGAGITYEIARWGTSQDFHVRISMATVERSGPFSTFPSYRRWSCLAGEAPITLAIAGTSYRLAAIGDNVHYSGSELVEAAVAAPTQLLNVIATDEIIAVGHGALPRDRVARFVIALVDTPELPRWHALRDTDMDVVPAGCVWVV